MKSVCYNYDYLQKELSWTQNIDNIFFSKKAALKREFNALYASLFRKPDDYIKVIEALGTKKIGMTRTEIIENSGVNQGGKLTKLAFERLCLQHEDQIKKALGISGVVSSAYSWVFRPKTPETKGVQIDLLIDRDDNVINLCEMKFSEKLYTITKDYDNELRRKASVFAAQTATKKAIRIVMVTTYGLNENQWANNIMNQVVMDDLFEK